MNVWYSITDYEETETEKYCNLKRIIHQLLKICNYYGIAKGLNKCAKDVIISILVDFEFDEENENIVSRRRLMWFYIEELRNDKFMKKHVFW